MKPEENAKKLGEEAYARYLADPTEKNKRLFLCVVRLEEYEKLPVEWREAVKDELDKHDKGIEIDYMDIRE